MAVDHAEERKQRVVSNSMRPDGCPDQAVRRSSRMEGRRKVTTSREEARGWHQDLRIGEARRKAEDMRNIRSNMHASAVKLRTGNAPCILQTNNQ
jgi:hypothetical protein